MNYRPFIGSWRFGHADYAQRWQKPGDEVNTDVPSFVYPYPTNNLRDLFYNQSTVLVEKGDHIRLQYINLSYSLGKKILNRLSMKSFQVSLYINNVGILWRANDKDIDPDAALIDFPTPRSYAFAVRAGF